jgi:4-hydroxybenzoate polyprenyltransferase
MNPQPSKRARATMVVIAFWLLFAFWWLALYFGLHGGIITYSLLLTAIALFVKAICASSRLSKDEVSGD